MQKSQRTSSGIIGVFFNVKPFITFSNGQCIHAPKFVVKNARAIRKLHKRLSVSKSPKSIEKLERQIVHFTKHAKAKLADWHYKVAHRICRRFTVSYIPKTVPSSKFALDYDFGGFVCKLHAVSKKYDVSIVEVPDFTLVCSYCRTAYLDKIRPQDRTLSCSHCQVTFPRDLTMAQQLEHANNILGTS